MMNENSVIERKIKDRLQEKREMDGFIAGGMQVHGQTKREYNEFVSHMRGVLDDDPFWMAFVCAAK